MAGVQFANRFLIVRNVIDASKIYEIKKVNNFRLFFQTFSELKKINVIIDNET